MRWIATAWARLGWRHVALAAALSVLWPMIGPVGGAWLFPLQRQNDLIANFLSCRWIVREFALVWFALVADAAFDDGVPAWLAYGAAALATLLVSPELDRLAARWVYGFDGNRAYVRFWQVQLLSQGTLGMAVYAYWRVGHKSLERLHETETGRLRLQQRLEAATLNALQARVDPQLLSDALDRVARVHATDPAAADRLLGDLIALLRAMLPHDEPTQSTVGHELALVEAWLHVRRQLADGLPTVDLRAPAASRAEAMPPMLVLPLLRDVLATSDAQSRWTLAVAVEDGALRIDLASLGPPPVRLPELGALHDRLQALHGDAARLQAAPEARAWTIALPRLAREDAA